MNADGGRESNSSTCFSAYSYLVCRAQNFQLYTNQTPSTVAYGHTSKGFSNEIPTTARQNPSHELSTPTHSNKRSIFWPIKNPLIKSHLKNSSTTGDENVNPQNTSSSKAMVLSVVVAINNKSPQTLPKRVAHGFSHPQAVARGRAASTFIHLSCYTPTPDLHSQLSRACIS